jgi:hypothetical protein
MLGTSCRKTRRKKLPEFSNHTNKSTNHTLCNKP